MPTIVEQIQRDALDTTIPVSTLLRRVKLAAAKLGIPSVESWVDAELNGYTASVPDYRMVYGRPMFFNPFHGWLPITGNIEAINQRAVGQTVASIEALISESHGSLHMPYPDKISEALFPDKRTRFNCALEIDNSQLINIIDQVRGLVLDWAIKLEKAGISGTEFTFSTEEKRIAKEATVTNIHLSNVGAVTGNIGSGNVARDITSTSMSASPARDLVGQIRRHQDELVSAGVNREDLQQRLQAIEAAVRSGEPAPSTLRQLLADLHNTVSGAAGNVIGSGILGLLAPYVGAAGS
jgi:hypothetical protein